LIVEPFDTALLVDNALFLRLGKHFLFNAETDIREIEIGDFITLKAD